MGSIRWDEEFAACPLGDVRRNRRAADITQALYEGSGRSVASAMRSWARVKGCSRLLRQPNVRHSALLQGHIQQTIQRARTHPRVLAIQDTTTCSFSGRQPIDGLGPIDTALKVQGFLTHTTLLVDAEKGEVLGVGHQQVWARSWTARPPKERADQRKKRPRESEHWGQGQEGLARAMGRQKDEAGDWSAIPEGSPDVLAVFDREGDVFEALETLHALGHGYVIRATRSRRVVAQKELFFAQVEQSPVLGRLPFEVPRRAGLSPRSTTLTFRALEMTLRVHLPSAMVQPVGPGDGGSLL